MYLLIAFAMINLVKSGQNGYATNPVTNAPRCAGKHFSCGVTIRSADVGKTVLVESPSYPAKITCGVNCVIKIKTEPDFKILVRWKGFIMDGCHNGNKLRIVDGEKQDFYCGDKLPSKYISKHNELEIAIAAVDMGRNDRGVIYKFTYEAVTEEFELENRITDEPQISNENRPPVNPKPSFTAQKGKKFQPLQVRPNQQKNPPKKFKKRKIYSKQSQNAQAPQQSKQVAQQPQQSSQKSQQKPQKMQQRYQQSQLVMKRPQNQIQKKLLQRQSMQKIQSPNSINHPKNTLQQLQQRESASVKLKQVQEELYYAELARNRKRENDYAYRNNYALGADMVIIEEDEEVSELNPLIISVCSALAITALLIPAIIGVNYYLSKKYKKEPIDDVRRFT